MALRTPFYSKYLEHSGNIVEIQNWEIPWDFGSVEEEMKMVRERAGFVDYSFNNMLAVTGRDAFNFLQKMIVSDLKKIRPGKAIYSMLVDENGNVVDEVTIFWMEENYFFYNGEAPLRAQAIEWLKKHAQGFDVKIIQLGTCLLSLQGPRSREVLQSVMDIKDLPRFSFKKAVIRDIPALVARLGFSGELGYEFYIYPEYASDLWDTLMEIGKDHRVRPYGIEATFILGIEKGYLFDHDYYEGASPLELDLGWTVAFDKEEFIGKEALLKRKNEGLKTKLVAFEVTDPQVFAEEKDKLFKEGKEVGCVTIAGTGPSVGKASIGRGWVKIEHANEGEKLDLEHEGTKTKVKVALNRDWYDPENKKVKD